jgi:hypothetical protein
VDNIDYKKLKKDLLNKVGTSGIMPLIVSVDSASDKKFLQLEKEYNLDISRYMKD